MSENSDQKLVKQKSGDNSLSEIQVGTAKSIDLSHLPEEQRVELQMEHARGMIDLQRKALELGVDEASLRNTLTNLNETTREATDVGASVTVSHTQSSSIGRTEVIMGNTDHAKKGRLSKSQTGETNWTPLYIGLGVVAVLILVSIL